MLRLTERYCPTGLRSSKGIRSRIIGETNTGCLLIMVNTVERTSIELVDSKGENKTVVSFTRYMDLINGDLSPDMEFVHFTERISAASGFGYQSVIYHLPTTSKSKLFVADNPIFAIFLPSKHPKSCRFLHMIGSKLTDVRGLVTNNSIITEKIRGGLHIQNMLGWEYKRLLETLVLVHNFENQTIITEVNVSNDLAVEKQPMRFKFSRTCFLPPELSLLPSANVHLPYFRSSCTRFFVHSFENRTCIIEQLFESVNDVVFSILVHPCSFEHKVCVHCETNCPISCNIYGSFIMIFVLNCFAEVIDISTTPPICYQIPKELIEVPVIKSYTIPLEGNRLIDGSTGRVFKCDLNFMIDAIEGQSDEMFSLLASMAARLRDARLQSSLIQTAVLSQGIYQVWRTWKTFFLYLKEVKEPEARLRASLPAKTKSLGDMLIYKKSLQRQSLPKNIRQILDEYDKTFPSTSTMSREDKFWYYIEKEMAMISFEDAFNIAIQKLSNENMIVIQIHNAIEGWLETCKPDDYWKFVILTIFKMQTEIHFLPAIPQIDDKISHLTYTNEMEGVKALLQQFAAIIDIKTDDQIEGNLESLASINGGIIDDTFNL